MRAYYNEFDPYAAQWLRNLIAAGHITAGEVDERSILDVRPDDLVGFDRCHFFAGIGVWDYALNLAGWGERPVWTGSCPCQPFSTAGRRAGTDDERHLWPVWYELIRECRPGAVLGEQVASSAVVGGVKPSVEPAWLDVVFADLEAAHYACGAADIPAAGVGAPHIRQRLWFVAESNGQRRERVGLHLCPGQSRSAVSEIGRGCEAGDVADAAGAGRRSERPHGDTADGAEALRAGEALLGRCGATVLLGDAHDAGLERQQLGRDGSDQRPLGQAGVAGFWSDADWIPCRDGKARPVEPGTFPLAPRASNHMGRLRAYGNAICAEAARAFIEAVMQVRP